MLRRALARAFFSTASPPSLGVLNTQSIPLRAGEVLLSASSHANKAAATRSWMMCAAPCAYVGTVKCIDVFQGFTDGLPLMTLPWTLLMAGAAAFTTFVSFGTLRSMARAVVLTADGQSLRVYPFSLTPFSLRGLGAPVTVPIRLLREAADFGTKKDATAEDLIYVKVRHDGVRGEKLSPIAFCVEKPPRAELALPPVRGSGLSFTARGLSPTSVPLDLAATSLRALPMARSDHEAFRSYALLAWVLNGNPVMDMARLRSGDWQLESMAAQLGAADRATLHEVGLGRWREVLDKGTGRPYYYCAETWDVAWGPPPGWREWRAALAEREKAEAPAL